MGMEEFQEEADIPMQYAQEFERIEQNEERVESAVERVEKKRKERRRYYAFLEAKVSSKRVATYQKVGYKNEKPMLRLQTQQNQIGQGGHGGQGSVNFGS